MACTNGESGREGSVTVLSYEYGSGYGAVSRGTGDGGAHTSKRRAMSSGLRSARLPMGERERGIRSRRIHLCLYMTG